MTIKNVKFFLKTDTGRRLNQWDNKDDALWSENEKLLIRTAIKQFENVCDISISETFDSEEGNIIIWK